MIKRLLAKLALWILDGQYVPVSWLTQARKERDDENDSWAKQYDAEVAFLQRQADIYLNRALVAELELTISRAGNYTENVQIGSPQMIDIRVPKKVRS